MNWDRSNTIALAACACVKCHGVGCWDGTPCACVLREIFRQCERKYWDCAEDIHLGRQWMDDHASGSTNTTRMYSNVRIEYMVDFRGIARHALTDFEYRIFRVHVLLGAEWKACCVRTGQTRGNFFHCVYRIEQKLGRAFAETLPFPLFPTGEYFRSPVRTRYRAKYVERVPKKREKPVRPVLLAMAAGQACAFAGDGGACDFHQRGAA